MKYGKYGMDEKKKVERVLSLNKTECILECIKKERDFISFLWIA